MLNKPERRTDRTLLDSYHSMHCLACNRRGDTVGHHVKSKGSGGPDELWNLMPLSFNCHVEVHQIGLTKFSEKYYKVALWLMAHGWEFCLKRMKWSHK